GLKKKTAGFDPRRILGYFRSALSEQPENLLVRLVGQRQCDRGNLLTGLQRRQVRSFLVRVGQRQVIRTDLQRVDDVLGEILTSLNDRQACTKFSTLRTQRIGGRRNGGERRIDIGIPHPVIASSRDVESARRRVGETVDRHRRRAGFVEVDLEIVAVQQVNAVEPRVLGQLVDLREQVVELGGEVRTSRRIRGLKGLVRKRLRGVHKLLNGGDALVRGLHRLHGVRFSIQKIAEVRSAALQALRREEAVRIVERRVDLLARRETGRGLREQIGRVLECEQILTHASGESNITHSSVLS